MHSPSTLRTILSAVKKHPLMMSPVLLEYTLRGDIIGRMAEKGLIGSEIHGALADLPTPDLQGAIAYCLERGWLIRTSGFYPSLNVTASGELRLATSHVHVHEASPEGAYKTYHAWRRSVARSLRKPPYRIVPNSIVNHLASLRPTTLDQLLGVPGLGKRRALRYQDDLLAVGRELASIHA